MFSMKCLIFLIFSTVVFLVGNLLSKKKNGMKNQGSPFECGVNVLEFSEVPMSIRFFMLMVVFLIFDVELVLLLPYVLYLYAGASFFNSVSFVVFLMILLIGVFVEWNQYLLEWV